MKDESCDSGKLVRDTAHSACATRNSGVAGRVATTGQIHRRARPDTLAVEHQLSRGVFDNAARHEPARHQGHVGIHLIPVGCGSAVPS